MEKYTEAETSLIGAKEACARTGNDLTQANILRGLGNVKEAQAQYSEAEDWLIQAEALSIRIGDHLGQAHALGALGVVYRSQGRNEESEKSFSRAGEVYSRLGYKTGQANTSFGLGHLRRKQGRQVLGSIGALYRGTRHLCPHWQNPRPRVCAKLLSHRFKEQEQIPTSSPLSNNAAFPGPPANP